MAEQRDTELSECLNEAIQTIEINVKKVLRENFDEIEAKLNSRQKENEINERGENDKNTKSEQKSFKEKTFHARKSLLTILFESRHTSSVYNLFLAILVLIITNSWAIDLYEHGKIDLSFDLIFWAFGSFPIVMVIWFCMFVSTIIIVYPVFHYWSHIPKLPNVAEKSFCISLYFLYICLLFYFPTKFLFLYNLPMASSYIVICEQVRLLMKVHAFIRENTTKALLFKQSHCHKTDDSTANVQPCPPFEKYLYFLFAPTLIYKDEYPRTRSTDWWYVAKNFAQCIGCIFYTSYVMTHLCIPLFKDFNPEFVNLRTFLYMSFRCILPGGLTLILLFWGLLHCWMNMFAEMLTFADRHFYNDWWNSRSMANYYRDWNLIIHQWCFYYVYRDFSLLLGGRRKIAALFVFLLSAIIHEYSFITGFKLFFPIMFVLYFIFGGMFFFVSRLIRMDQTWNVLMWFNLLIGQGMFMAFYSMEWYARIKCPAIYNNYKDILIPRLWICSYS